MIKDSIKSLISGIDLNQNEAMNAMEQIMDGNATDAQISAFITAIRMKGETTDELYGCAKVMDSKVEKVNLDRDAIDIVGTGGDGVGTFNVSTCSAFVVAAAGLPVAKHGNRSISSKCGSADVLETLGANIQMTPLQAKECFDLTDICFMFAPGYHKSMKYAAGPRKELGVRSIFNILGPITNPARAPFRLIGVYDPNLLEPIVKVLNKLGISNVMAVYGKDGLDEISISGPTTVFESKNGNMIGYILNPERVGLKTYPVEQVLGGNPDENAEILKNVLNGQLGAKRDIVLFNSAASLYIGGKAATLKEGVKLAAEAIDSGAAMKKLNDYIEQSNLITGGNIK